MRPLVEYLLSWIILAFFGGQVCPFLESLNLFQWALILLVAFSSTFGIRAFLLQPLVYKTPETHRAARRFYLEFGLFVAAGFGVSAFNTLAFGFPFFGSGVLTVVLGYSVLGFFVATDLALQQERELARQFEASRSRAEDMGKYFPLTRKFILISSISVLSITVVTFLIISHDLSWLSEQMGTVNWASARRSVFLEVVFILSIFLFLITNLILSYSQNLRILLKNQIDTLEEVNRGKLDGFVPVFTNDEFAVIADHTNRMIEGLRVRTEELQLTQDVTILSLASLAETRDNETGAHILRTQHYIRILSEYLKTHLTLDGQLSDEVIDLLFKSAPLHDVGKVGVPDAILLKPGRLDESEWKQMRLHPIYGF
ncbi:MAG TPA: HD domain-containing protein, partial [Spirochaetia bacterium]|nr:HD domain-containing protein [Spirochaetia bacterium]